MGRTFLFYKNRLTKSQQVFIYDRKMSKESLRLVTCFNFNPSPEISRNLPRAKIGKISNLKSKMKDGFHYRKRYLEISKFFHIGEEVKSRHKHNSQE